MRAIVTQLPVVGSAFDAIIGTYGSRIVQERQEYLLRQLDVRVGALEDDGKGGREFFASEEGIDLMMAGLVASGRTRHREKIRLYAAILAGAAMDDRPAAAEPEALLGSLIDLTPIEVQMLRLIHENLHRGWEATIPTFPPEAQDMLGLHVARLTAAGFLGTTHLSGLGGGNSITAGTHALTALMSLAPTLGEDEPFADGPRRQPVPGQ